MEDKYNKLLEEKKDFILFCEVMDGYEACLIEEHEKEEKFFNEEVLPLLSPEQYETIKEYMVESGARGGFRITETPCDGEKDCDYEDIEAYVNQWRNGGHTGDDFAGTISIALPNGKYFTYDYEC